MVKVERTGAAPALLAPAHFLIVEAPYYVAIGAMLRAGAEAALRTAGATFDVFQVPGALEVPTAMQIALMAAERASRPYAGALGLGCIIRGETYHFEVVANESARGIMQIGISGGVPVGNGILTLDTEAQAIARADPAQGNKGGEAAEAAMVLWRIRQDAEALR